MSRNEKIQAIAIIFIILAVIGILAGVSTRLLSRNGRTFGDIRDGLGQLGSQLDDASGSLEEAQEGITESIDNITDHRQSISRTEDAYVKATTEFNNRLEEYRRENERELEQLRSRVDSNRGEVDRILTGLDEIKDFSGLSERQSSRARGSIEEVREVLQQLIDLEQD